MEGMEGAGSRRQDTFGLREIGLNLSTETGDAASMMYTADASVDTVMAPLGVRTERDAPGGGIGRRVVAAKKKVTRYFPGKAPKWVRDDAPEDAPVFSGKPPKGFHDADGRRASGRRRAAAPVVLKGGRASDYSSEKKVLEAEDDTFIAPAPRVKREVARARAAPVVLKRAAPAAPREASDSESECEGDAAPPVEAEDADEAAARRARVRAKLKARAAARANADAAEDAADAARAAAAGDGDGDGDGDDEDVPRRRPPASSAEVAEAARSSSSSSSSAAEEDASSSSSSSDESDASSEAARPVFVPRSQRGTIHQQEADEARERERDAARKARRKERAKESRALVADVVLRGEKEAAKAHFGAGDDHGSDFDAPDDEDDLDDPLEFEAWRVRELARATRERDDRAKAAEEAAETERRRALTPAARAAEDEASGKGKGKEKAKWKFLQKYHHKGAFYMDDDTLAKAGSEDVRNRDTDGAVLDDNFDKASLPKVLQVRDFGFQGRTKYTHLADQDTTFVDKDNPMNGWLKSRGRKDDPLRKKYESKMAGTKDIDAAFQRRKDRR